MISVVRKVCEYNGLRVGGSVYVDSVSQAAAVSLFLFAGRFALACFIYDLAVHTPRFTNVGFVCSGCLGTRRQADPMKQLALEVVARTLDPAQISLLAAEFDHADNNNNGEVSTSAPTACNVS